MTHSPHFPVAPPALAVPEAEDLLTESPHDSFPLRLLSLHWAIGLEMLVLGAGTPPPPQAPDGFQAFWEEG